MNKLFYLFSAVLFTLALNSGVASAGSKPADAIPAEIVAETDQTQISETAFSGHDLSPWGMYQAADVVVRSVMILLLLASLATWTVLLFKTRQLQLARREAGKLLQQLNHCDNVASAASFNAGLQGGVTSLLQATQLELQLSGQGNASDAGIKERVAARLDRSQAQLTRQMNQGTGILATIGSVAPFVGLFGTVWGIMNSFIGIAQTNTTNLAVVAPGIAEALLATAIGLVAAIPAVVVYNYFSRVIAVYRAQLADIVSAVMVIVSRELDRNAVVASDNNHSQTRCTLQDAS